MRRWASIAAFALVLTIPLWAQRGGGHVGGGHAGGGGHVGGGMHSGSGSGGFRSGGGMRSGSVAMRGFNHGATFSQRGFNRPFLHDGFHGRHFHNHFGNGFRNNCFGFGCGYYGYYPWAYGAYDPYWWWDTGSSSYEDDYNQNLATAAEMNRQNLEEQRMLRQEEGDGDQDSYSDTPRAPRSVRPGNQNQNEEQVGAAIMPNTVLVFRDQHKQEVSNYAIVGQTLYNFAPRHTQKIPLADLDLAATTKANEDQGVDFRVPSSGEAQ